MPFELADRGVELIQQPLGGADQGQRVESGQVRFQRREELRARRAAMLEEVQELSGLVIHRKMEPQLRASAKTIPHPIRVALISCHEASPNDPLSLAISSEPMTFNDKRGRSIQIFVDGDDASAKHQGRQIGEITTTGEREIDDHTAPYPPKITFMDVDEAYQGAGIAMEMLRQLSEELGDLEPADRETGRGGQNALTPAGLALTRAAQRKGYVLPFDEEAPDDDE